MEKNDFSLTPLPPLDLDGYFLPGVEAETRIMIAQERLGEPQRNEKLFIAKQFPLLECSILLILAASFFLFLFWWRRNGRNIPSLTQQLSFREEAERDLAILSRDLRLRKCGGQESYQRMEKILVRLVQGRWGVLLFPLSLEEKKHFIEERFSSCKESLVPLVERAERVRFGKEDVVISSVERDIKLLRKIIIEAG